MRIAELFTYLYLTGMILFTLAMDPDDDTWFIVWALWQNLAYGSFLAFLSIFMLTRIRQFLWVTIYTGALLAWEITSLFTGLSIDNTYAVAMAFGLLAILCILLTVFTRIK
jgi:hypothetical protein